MVVLDRNTTAIPQQLEHYRIKQFKYSTTAEKQPRKASKSSSTENNLEMAGLRKELALLKVEDGQTVAKAIEAKQAVPGGGNTARDSERVEVVARRRPVDQQPKIKRAERDVAGVEGLERRRSAAQSDSDNDSHTTVITVDEGRRRRSSVITSSGRSSTDSIERRREPRYYSPRRSKDLGRRDFYVVQVTEPLPRARRASKEVTKFREVTIYQKEARYTAVH